MFTLALPSEDYWLDLGLGVRVKVRPLTGVVAAAARSAAGAEVSTLRKLAAEREEAGAPLDGLPDLTDPHIREAMLKVAYARGLARYGIVDWEGVGNGDGTEALPFTQAGAIELAAHPDMMDRFVESYLADIERARAEGNGSGTTPGGSTGGVSNTAEGAATASALTAPDTTLIH